MRFLILFFLAFSSSAKAAQPYYYRCMFKNGSALIRQFTFRSPDHIVPIGRISVSNRRHTLQMTLTPEGKLWANAGAAPEATQTVSIVGFSIEKSPRPTFHLTFPDDLEVSCK